MPFFLIYDFLVYDGHHVAPVMYPAARPGPISQLQRFFPVALTSFHQLPLIHLLNFLSIRSVAPVHFLLGYVTIILMQLPVGPVACLGVKPVLADSPNVRQYLSFDLV